jgi:hypothetical protein
MKRGDLVRFRIGRDGITRDIIWDTGLILEILLNFDVGDKCKILDSGGRIKLISSCGTEVLLNHNETR